VEKGINEKKRVSREIGLKRTHALKTAKGRGKARKSSRH